MTAPATPRPICGAPRKDGSPCPSVIPFRPPGRLCIAHDPAAKAAKKSAEHKGGASLRDKHRKAIRRDDLPVSVPPLDWSTPQALLAWCESRGAAVEEGRLDKRLVPEELAKIARTIHELEQLAGLRDALLKIEHGGPVVALLAQLRAGDGAPPRPLPWKARRLIAGPPAEGGA